MTTLAPNITSNTIVTPGIISPEQIEALNSRTVPKEYNDSVTSFIEKREEAEAKLLIEGHLKFPPPRVCGYHLAIKLFLGNDALSEVTNSIGEKIKIINPSVNIDANKWRSCTGLVLAVGPDAYRGKRFEERSGPWAKVGDWVVFPRHEGTQFNYRGIPMYFVPDDRLFAVIDDPSYVTRD